jgi:conjugative relaxase-like TrwC/TraI family protein
MLTISKPLRAAQVVTYHAEAFSNGRENYYTEGAEIQGQWHGRLASAWGLTGEVQADHIARLAAGQHPTSGETLVQRQRSRTYTNAHGEEVTTKGHRAAWDLTFSAPKSLSLTALVGGDDRVRQAHVDSVTVALAEVERYVQARIGRNHPAETTGQWVAARFEHDSARPVEGYAAPHLHTHVVVFNVTVRNTGEPRAIQPRELYKAQAYATAIYRSEYALRLKALGYAIERGTSGEPEIRGYTQAYLEASSPRGQQIEEHLAKGSHRGAEAAYIAAHETRAAKIEDSHEAMRARHQALADAHGNQPAQIVSAARDQSLRQTPASPTLTAQEAVTFAKERNFEREAVVDERHVLRDALRRSMGDLALADIKTEFEHRVEVGEFVEAASRPGAAGRALTTREMIALEQETIEIMRAGQGTQPVLVVGMTPQDLAHRYPQLNDGQRSAVHQVLTSRDAIMALEGVAGSGKTTALAAVRDATERAGYTVEGLAPTSRAAHQLADAILASDTLQRHLASGGPSPEGAPRLFVVDESSLTSTKQMYDFVHRLRPQDRVLLVGDVRQHQAVDAGRPYQQLQEAGIHVARLDDIVRQKDPALRAVVEQLAHGEVSRAIHTLDQQGRVHHIPERHERLSAIAREFAKDPDGTLVVSPDNRSRREINQIIHGRMQAAGQVAAYQQRVRVLVPRQDITGADRQWAQQYVPGDIVRYTRGSTVVPLDAGEYARVDHVHAQDNLLTVTRLRGGQVTYDPRRLRGVTLYREEDRAFAIGERVQFTAPYRERHVANRELGTIEHIDPEGQLRVRLDSGRRLAFALDAHPHLDYGYAVTSHSSQGQTADRVIVHVDTTLAGESLVNRRLAYVAVSRGRYDAQIYTDDKARLGEALSRDVSHESALDVVRAPDSPAATLEPSPARRREVQLTITR